MNRARAIGIVSPVLSAPRAISKNHSSITFSIADTRYSKGDTDALVKVYLTAVHATGLITAGTRAIPLVVDICSEVTILLNVASNKFGVIERQFGTPIVHHTSVQFHVDILCTNSIRQSDKVDGKNSDTRTCTMQCHGIGAITLNHHRTFAIVVVAPVLSAPCAISKDHGGLTLCVTNTCYGKCGRNRLLEINLAANEYRSLIRTSTRAIPFVIDIEAIVTIALDIALNGIVISDGDTLLHRFLLTYRTDSQLQGALRQTGRSTLGSHLQGFAISIINLIDSARPVATQRQEYAITILGSETNTINTCYILQLLSCLADQLFYLIDSRHFALHFGITIDIQRGQYIIVGSSNIPWCIIIIAGRAIIECLVAIT